MRQEGQSERRCGYSGRGQSDEATNQGMKVASSNWKRQGVDSPLEHPDKTQPTILTL